jgi:H+/Cl- antiporter ClcA
LPAAIILGIITGLLGALFIHVSITLGMYRKKYINTNFKKILECCIFAFVTASAFYGVAALRKSNCYKRTSGTDNSEERQFACPDDTEYNPFATLIFNTEGGTIR